MAWWGAPHALMVMLGGNFMSGERERINYNGVDIAILEDALYNFAPTVYTRR